MNNLWTGFVFVLNKSKQADSTNSSVQILCLVYCAASGLVAMLLYVIAPLMQSLRHCTTAKHLYAEARGRGWQHVMSMHAPFHGELACHTCVMSMHARLIACSHVMHVLHALCMSIAYSCVHACLHMVTTCTRHNLAVQATQGPPPCHLGRW